MRYKIIIDSCGELLDEWKNDERFETVPLTLMVGAEQIIDDETFNQKEFLKKVADCPECPKSACPSPERYMKAYDCEAEHIYAVTLSSELSGSYTVHFWEEIFFWKITRRKRSMCLIPVRHLWVRH